MKKFRKWLSKQNNSEIARKVGVTRQAVSLWRRGKRNPSLRHITTLLKKYKTLKNGDFLA